MTKVSSDAELALALTMQGAAGLEPVYTAYSARLYTYALTMLRDPQAAQDVVHDALLVAAGSIGQLRDPSRFRPWLYAITRNECLRALRGRKRFSTSDEVIDVADTVDFEAGLRREEAARLIGQALAVMSPADRDVVSLALQHDLDVDRISQVTGTSTNTVHARLSRARVGLSDAVTALALYRSRRKCEQLRALVADHPLTPLLRKRIQRHVKSCDECQQRRKAALAAVTPAMASPVLLTPPDGLRSRLLESARQGHAVPLASRAAPFTSDGFPVPLDARSGRKWPLVLGAAGAVLVILGLGLFALGGQDSAPSAQTGTISTPTVPPSIPQPSPPAPAFPSETTLDDAPSTQPNAPRRTRAPQVVAQPTPTTSTARRSQRPAQTTTPTPSSSKTTPPKQPTATPTLTTGSPAQTQQPAQPAPPAQPPMITSVTLIDEDRADDGSFTRCDAFTLRVEVEVSGAVDSTEAVITPADSTVLLTGDPLQARVTLPPGEYAVTVHATGPAGVASREAGSILHICPG